MVFSSIVFLIYFLPLFLLTYYFASKKLKNSVILLFSILFYSWGAPTFIFVIIGTTFLDFHLVKWMSKSQNEKERKLLLGLSVFVNLGLLVYFKYSNFFIENINSLLGAFGSAPITWTKLILPIGISFYTFETITYVVDVYRQVHKPLPRFWDYLLYILLFPKLIAGPIIRYHDIAQQLQNRSNNETIDNRLTGFYRFAIGLAKKVILANHLGLHADIIFSSDFSSLDPISAWVGILAYTFQIYFDFSGYSDMAIGLAKMIGFKFPENFDNPYISQSITEFWRRWHISLGLWMRNYLYIPLGGNQVATKSRLYFNLWIVFLASGLWHGASWNFVLWGAYHGLFLVLERVFLHRLYLKMGKFLSTILTFMVVVIGWVFFRIEGVSDAYVFLSRLFSFNIKTSFVFESEFMTYLSLAIFFAFFAYSRRGKKLQVSVFNDRYTLGGHLAMSTAVIILMFISISTITSFSFNPFIYFRF